MNLVGENLSYKLTEELQLRKISFNFEKGKLYTILGRTLSGKTTLLKTIAGLLMPDSGSIRFEEFLRDTCVEKEYCHGLSAIH